MPLILRILAGSSGLLVRGGRFLGGVGKGLFQFGKATTKAGLVGKAVGSTVRKGANLGITGFTLWWLYDELVGTGESGEQSDSATLKELSEAVSSNFMEAVFNPSVVAVLNYPEMFDNKLASTLLARVGVDTIAKGDETSEVVGWSQLALSQYILLAPSSGTTLYGPDEMTTVLEHIDSELSDSDSPIGFTQEIIDVANAIIDSNLPDSTLRTVDFFVYFLETLVSETSNFNHQIM